MNFTRLQLFIVGLVWGEVLDFFADQRVLPSTSASRDFQSFGGDSVTPGSPSRDAECTPGHR